ncbi:TIGR01777 family oxidoreductase [Muricauda oceani]|uniref:TIGR01777 family protein n=1 Tax=Flagellimonas oceani TaxID=2698672 RepID=A0A6G7J4D7_9FLAO|nr:TIGR01777 family oxidoreductase [Allomuricauda oceani]MBW8243345.1 TIGR01777 family oxidoreductase [Allomuricauda oceani]QII45317.1 TIGR01777 family protein [Allomuricauda oceani]
MKVLITGATGLVGQAIVKVLHQKGIPVNYLTTSKDKIDSSEDFQGFYWNPNKGEIDLECFRDVQAIINLAGASIAKRWTPKHKKRVLSSRINSLQTLKNGLERSNNREVECLVSASAIGIYPDSVCDYYDEETNKVDDGFLGEVVTKWEAEANTFQSLGLDVAKIRIGLVLSADGGALPKMAFPVKNFIGAPIGTGDQWQSWVHIEDLAQMFVFAVENNLKGVYNAVAPNPVTNTKLTKELARVLDRPLWLPNVPAFLLKAILGKMSTLLLASQRVSGKKIEEEGFTFQYANICQALKNLYASQEEGIPASIEA